MCGGLKKHSPLFCLKTHPMREKLRILTIFLATLRVVCLFGASGYFVYNDLQEQIAFDKKLEEQITENKQSTLHDYERQENEFYAACWTSALYLAFSCSYAVVLYGGIKRSRYVLITWVGFSWFLPVVVVSQVVYFIDVYSYHIKIPEVKNSDGIVTQEEKIVYPFLYIFISWGLMFLLTGYEIWVFLSYENDIRIGEEVHLGRIEQRQIQRTDSMEIRSLGHEEFIGAIGQHPSYRIAEQYLHKSRQIHVDTLPSVKPSEI